MKTRISGICNVNYNHQPTITALPNDNVNATAIAKHIDLINYPTEDPDIKLLIQRIDILRKENSDLTNQIRYYEKYTKFLEERLGMDKND